MVQLPKGASMGAPQTQKRKRLLAEITSEQMGLCSRDYRRHLAVCEEYDTEPTNFVIFAAEWLEVRAKVEKTSAGERPNEDHQARNYGAMYYGKKGFE
ncbi:MAG TPA: hypothetical protein VFY40_13440 [Blastocatellia bacterium]|nr:hypothetical protein [Blastocatellia bacterium]